MASSKHKEADKKRKAIKRQNETNLERNIRLEKIKKEYKVSTSKKSQGKQLCSMV